MENIYLFAALILFFSLITSYFSIPSIINLVKTKNLMDNPNERSSHNTKTPTLGGVAVFTSVSISLMLSSCLLEKEVPYQYIVPILLSLIILFFIGIQDDLLNIYPIKKFIGQIIVSILIISLTNYRITNFHGIFGINELSYIISFLTTIFAYVLIINSFNLIDGVDGLAGTFALIVSIIFGIYFLSVNSFFMALISFSLIGSLVAFLKFNLSTKNKIFMGDTGSMIIGFLLAFQAIVFINLNQTLAPSKIENFIIITIAILSFPIIDTFRVFSIRIMNNKNPFYADRNHAHHKLLDLGFTHKQVTIIVETYTLYVAYFTYNLRFLNPNTLLIILLFTILIAFYPIYKSNFTSPKISSLKKTNQFPK